MLHSPSKHLPHPQSLGEIRNCDPYLVGSAHSPDQHGQCRVTPWPCGPTAHMLCRAALPLKALEENRGRGVGMASKIRGGLERDKKEVELGLKVSWREKC